MLRPRIAIIISLLAWAVLFLRQYLEIGPLEAVPPIIPGVVAALALVGLARTAIPRRLRAPLFIAGLLTSGAGFALVGIEEENQADKDRWREREAGEISSVCDAVRGRVEDLLDVSTSIGETAGTFVRENTSLAAGDSVGFRLSAFQVLGSLSEQITRGELLPSGTEIGIQLFDSHGNRWAWAGWPQSLDARDRRFLSSGKELVYSRQVSLYRMLTHVVPVYEERDSLGSSEAATSGVERLGTVLFDMPLEVNYRVNNKFLKSASLAGDIARGAVAGIRFDYSPVDPSLPNLVTEPRGGVVLEQVGGVTGTEAAGLSGRAVVRSPMGNTLFGVTGYGRPFQYFLQRGNDRVSLFANLAVLASLVIYFGVSLRSFPKRLHVFKALYLVAAFVLIRYALIWFHPDLLTTRFKVFEPALFATPILGGLMRSAGDLLITSVFFVAALYGVLKIGRGVGEAKPGEPKLSSRSLYVVKGLSAAAASIGVFLLAEKFTGTVVTNANPRLVGETVRVFQLEVLVLHLSAFLMIAGIFLAGMICVWGLYRVGGSAGVFKPTAVGAGAILLVSLALFRFDMAVISLLALLLTVFAPRVVQREDLVSIVIGAFWFVVVVSAAAYVFFNQEYQGLRRAFIRERAVEVTHPSDNWKVFILEDILEDLSLEPSLRVSLSNPVHSNVQQLAFDMWAGSPLSLLGYSCAIHVFDGADSMVSRFAVEMPYRLRPDEPGERLETPSSQEWAVLDLTTETPQGAVRFYRGILNLEQYAMDDMGISARTSLGKVVVDLPFFFENLAWAARTGPQTPEVLKNVQEGGIAPRLEETAPVLLAKVKARRVLDSSTEILPVGYTFDKQTLERAADLQWPLLRTSGVTHRILAQQTDEPTVSIVAGFAVPTPVQHVLRWSTILSLYFFFTVGLMATIIVLKGLPWVRLVLPTLTPGRRIGFQQKLLGSFLLVALLPAVILGAFSVRMIRERFIQENKNEALYRAFGAAKSLNNLLVDELRALTDHYDFRALFEGKAPPEWRSDRERLLRLLVQPSSIGQKESGFETGGDVGGVPGGAVTPDTGGGLSGYGEVSGLFDRVSPGEVFVHYVDRKPYVGVIGEPFPFMSRGKKQTGAVYYARPINAELLGVFSDQVGADVNIFDRGEVVATSREGLLSGGFISSTMNADAFVKVSLMGVDHSIATEKAGRYRYQVAYVPLASADPSGNAAIGVPLLFRPESYSVEVEKAKSVVLSIFALLSAATIGLGLLLARGIFEPLKRLLEGTKRIARGDFSFELPSKRRDEIGTVVEAFNEMTHKVSQSQAALEERRRYLEVILVNIGTGVVSTDAVGRISAVNSAAERILGTRSKDLLGKTAAELANVEVLPEFFSRLAGEAQSAAGKSSEPPVVSSEVDIVKDGQKRTIKYMRTELDTDGRHMGTVLVFEDLTELINSKKLSAWVEMARQIAHEIKNPLTPIKLSTQFMVRAHQEGASDFDKIFRESSDTIMQQVDVLRGIASEFSSFGRLQQLHVEPHRLTPLVEDIVSPYRRNTSGVRVILDPPARDLRAVIDPEAVRKICTNLIENAMEAMSGGGELRVSCNEATYEGRGMVRLAFRDTGPGLGDEVKSRLFEPYFSTKTTGTGLGLAICRTLSREMGGEVTVENLRGGPGVEAILYLKPA